MTFELKEAIGIEAGFGNLQDISIENMPILSVAYAATMEAHPEEVKNLMGSSKDLVGFGVVQVIAIYESLEEQTEDR